MNISVTTLRNYLGDQALLIVQLQSELAAAQTRPESEPNPPADEPAVGQEPEPIEDDDTADGGGEYEDPYAEEDDEPVKLRLPRAERPPAA